MDIPLQLLTPMFYTFLVELVLQSDFHMNPFKGGNTFPVSSECIVVLVIKALSPVQSDAGLG